MAVVLSPFVFEFLKTLKENNNREWFSANKETYETAHLKMIDFADDLLAALKKHDNIETPNGKKSLYRIYRDTRFSKDKTPYKNYWSAGFSRATKLLRGGYYLHLEPGNSFAEGGFFGPNSDDLARIRQGISNNLEEFISITSDKNFKKLFGEICGDTVKTAPKGYSKDHPAIKFIRLKQFILHKSFDDKEVMSTDFIDTVVKTFVCMHPFLAFMSEVLTTDANGVPLYE